MRKIIFFLSMLAFVFAINSCDTVENLVTLEHDEDIVANETWKKGIHIVTGEISIDNATLVIEPGAIIKFEDGAGLVVGYYGSDATLIANGTADNPITFTSAAASKTPGDWDYIWFDEGATSASSMKFCNIEYGGGYSNNYGMVVIEGANITIENCNFSNAENDAISVEDDGYFKSFKNNTLADNGRYPITIEGNYAHTIGEGNTITTGYGILVDGDRYTQSDETWLKQTTAYIIDGGFDIGEASGASLTIAPGTTIKFTENSDITVGYVSNSFGTFIAEGTSDMPITFTSSASSKTPGDWDYIWFDDGTSSNSSFKHCIFEYGGGYSSNYGIVHLRNADVSFDNCTFQHSQKEAITLDDDSYFSSFTNNTLVDNGSYPIEIYGNHAHTIGSGNTITTNKGILVKNDEMEQEDVTWLKQTCPYIISGSLDIGSATGASLTIAPGIDIWFTESADIKVGYGSNNFGKLVADGTSETITFTSAAPAGNRTAGDWDYIWFDDGTSNGTMIKNCILEFGGGYSGSYGIIHIYKTNSPTITGNTIRNSASHGISMYNSSPTISGNTFSNISGSDIKN